MWKKHREHTSAGPVWGIRISSTSTYDLCFSMQSKSTKSGMVAFSSPKSLQQFRKHTGEQKNMVQTGEYMQSWEIRPTLVELLTTWPRTQNSHNLKNVFVSPMVNNMKYLKETQKNRNSERPQSHYHPKSTKQWNTVHSGKQARKIATKSAEKNSKMFILITPSKWWV